MSEPNDLKTRLLSHWEAWGRPTNRDECINETLMAFDCKAAADLLAALDELRDNWRGRWSGLFAEAEKYYFAGEELAEKHMETCARQWDAAVLELDEVLSKGPAKP